MVLINVLFMVVLVDKLRIRPAIFEIRVPGVAGTSSSRTPQSRGMTGMFIGCQVEADA
jgi:hypothetical protein